jgi:peptidoglycan hydrolase-like protein with peptidoglycan-binding domain
MPWEHCSATIDDDGACPTCSLTKDQWTLHFNVTRTFTVKAPANKSAALKFFLEGADGEYVPGAPFRVTFPDGTTAEGTLDDNGYANVPAPVAGACVVELPDHPTARAKATGRMLPGARLQTGTKHALMVGEPGRACAIPAAVFAFDSSFPGPGIFQYLEQVAALARDTPGARLVVFGHADATGDEAYNKTLSDRRARAVLALLTRDVALFDAVADEDGWGVAHEQAMLRGVGCNPGAIDGQAGAKTRAATRAFQGEYNDGVFHASGQRRAHADLAIDGVMGPATRRALRDAYVSVAPGGLATDRFAGPRFAGCSELNLIAEGAAAENRRVVVGFFDALPAEPFPCKTGDVSACPRDGPAPRRCGFYRGHVVEEARPTRSFFDFQWLKQRDGVAHLSALTSVPDGTPARFTVYRCTSPLPAPPPDSSTGAPRPDAGEVLATLDGTVRGGVAQALWTPADGQDPFDPASWFDDDLDLRIREDEDHAAPAPGSPASIDGLLAQRPRPPVFSIEAGEAWGFSGPPGQRLNRIRFSGAPSGSGTAVCSDGAVRTFEVKDGRPTHALDELDVVAVTLHERALTQEAGDEEVASG